MSSITSRLTTLERTAPPLETAKDRETRRLIDMLVRDPAACASTNKLARLVAGGADENSPELVVVAEEVRKHLERLESPEAGT